jgi:hypothetical protein
MHRRLQRLEENVPDAGCPACRDRRGQLVMVEAERRADGSVVLRDKEPEACAQCGVVPENVVQVILSYVAARNLNEDGYGPSAGSAGSES